MSKLQELRAKLLSKENQQNFTSDNAIYPFWNIPENSVAVLRFLPDGDESNDFFWVERQMIRLSFPGIVGQQTSKEVYVQVPCMEMWGDTCPVLTEVRPWFKDSDLEDLARKYWKKRSYVFQGIVRENPLKEDDGPENPIRRLVINPSIFDIIKAALMDPEMEEIPTDYTAGTDFRLIRTKQGDYASYKTSNYSRKTSSLTDDELSSIERFGLFRLNDFLPKKPGEKELAAISEMFAASVDGEMYDPNRWGEFYKPAGFDFKTNNSTVTQAVRPKVAAEVVSNNDDDNNDNDEDSVVEKEVTTATAKKNPHDILAEIKKRATASRS